MPFYAARRSQGDKETERERADVIDLTSDTESNDDDVTGLTYPSRDYRGSVIIDLTQEAGASHQEERVATNGEAKADVNDEVDISQNPANVQPFHVQEQQQAVTRRRVPVSHKGARDAKTAEQANAASKTLKAMRSPVPRATAPVQPEASASIEDRSRAAVAKKGKSAPKAISVTLWADHQGDVANNGMSITAVNNKADGKEKVGSVQPIELQAKTKVTHRTPLPNEDAKRKRGKTKGRKKSAKGKKQNALHTPAQAQRQGTFLHEKGESRNGKSKIAVSSKADGKENASNIQRIQEQAKAKATCRTPLTKKGAKRKRGPTKGRKRSTRRKKQNALSMPVPQQPQGTVSRERGENRVRKSNIAISKKACNAPSVQERRQKKAHHSKAPNAEAATAAASSCGSEESAHADSAEQLPTCWMCNRNRRCNRILIPSEKMFRLICFECQEGVSEF